MDQHVKTFGQYTRRLGRQCLQRLRHCSHWPILSCIGVLYGCSSESPEGFDATMQVAVIQQSIVATPPDNVCDVFDFESTAAWRSTEGSVGLDARHTRGQHSVALTPAGYTTMTSVPLSAAGAFTKVSFDVRLPVRQPNPYWQGDVQMFMQVPSRGVYNAYLGYHGLTGLTVGQWHSISFDVPSTVQNALHDQKYNDLTLTLVLNVAPGAAAHLFDNLRIPEVARCGIRIIVEKPALPATTPILFDWDIRKRGDTMDISGSVEPARNLASLELSLNGSVSSLPVSDLGRFDTSAILSHSPLGFPLDNRIELVATDDLGRHETVAFVARTVVDDVTPGRLMVRFNPQATEAAEVAAVASVGATIIRQYRPAREALLAIDNTADTRMVARTLMAHSAVAYASPETRGELDGLCSGGPETNDPRRGTTGQYYLKNNGTFVAFDTMLRRCEPGHDDCFNAQDECIVGVCTLGGSDPDSFSGNTGLACTNDTQCHSLVGPDSNCSSDRYCRSSAGTITGTACGVDADCRATDATATCVNTGLCGKTSAAGADVGWEDAQADICRIESDGPEVMVAFIEGAGVINVNHRDLAKRIWTNFTECGGTACTQDSDCTSALGTGSTCVQGQRCDGPDPDLLPDCVAGQASPGDGCPGTCGDDDRDGASDFADPDVQLLVERLNTNCIDDDADGTVDDGRPALPAQGAAETNCGNCTDDDGDGVTDDGCPALAVVGTAESALAEEDDDEDGYIDDIHGFHFDRAAFEGERAGSTHPAAVAALPMDISQWHATLVASSTASQLDNALELSGLNPRVRMITLSSGYARHYVEAVRYAASKGARVVSMSWGSYCSCGGTPCTGDSLAEYNDCVIARERMFRDALNPEMLYVVSAGNSRYNLSADAVPDAAGLCGGGPCRWRFPQNVGTYLNAEGALLTERTGTPFNIVIGAVDMRDRLVDYFLGDDIGSNIGQAVDFGAFTDGVDKLASSGSSGVERTGGGTSFAAPTAAGVASVVIARYPSLFDRQPTRVVERLRSTLVPCQAAATGLRGCSGNMQSAGRLDLFNALDTVNYPLPTPRLWANESWRLNDLSLSLTHDVEFVDGDGDGAIDFLFEIFGGPALEQQQPRIRWYDSASDTFTDQTATRLVDNVVGNYNKMAVGDLSGDGCTDIVLAGFLEPAPAPDPYRGQPNRLLLQNRSGSTCQGTFRNAADELVGGVPRLPTRVDITRDVDLMDVDGDGDLDLLFTNATLPAPGGNLGDQLLVNDGAGVFSDETWRLDSTVTGDAHRASTTCELNGDFFPDIVQATVGQNRILINDGTGQFNSESTARGMPLDTGFSHDVECVDLYRADGTVGQDGAPELIFARRDGLQNLLYLNNGSGVFTDISSRLGGYTDTSQEIELCDLDGSGAPEMLVGNGDIVTYLTQANRVLRLNATTGNFEDVGTSMGFEFASVQDLTEDIECGDLNHDGVVDAVLVGNVGGRNWLYRKH